MILRRRREGMPWAGAARPRLLMMMGVVTVVVSEAARVPLLILGVAFLIMGVALMIFAVKLYIALYRRWQVIKSKRGTSGAIKEPPWTWGLAVRRGFGMFGRAWREARERRRD